MGFSIAFTEIATEMDLTETEKGSVFAAYYYGFAVTQVRSSFLLLHLSTPFEMRKPNPFLVLVTALL